MFEEVSPSILLKSHSRNAMIGLGLRLSLSCHSAKSRQDCITLPSPNLTEWPAKNIAQELHVVTLMHYVKKWCLNSRSCFTRRYVQVVIYLVQYFNSWLFFFQPQNGCQVALLVTEEFRVVYSSNSWYLFFFGGGGSSRNFNDINSVSVC